MEKKTPRNGKDLSGQTLDKWRLLEFLGEGATAHVYRAEDLQHGEYVRAVKVFFMDRFSEQEKQERLKRLMLEAFLCKDPISHVIWVAEAPRETKEYLFHVMQYADGGSLRDLIGQTKKEEQQIEIDEVVRWGLQIASGLAALHAHERHILHRDICPANLLLNKGNILIADLGFAQVRDDLSRRSELDSTAPPHPGHWEYMSPQQRGDPRPVRPCDDIFSLGCVLFELLTLRMYQGEEDKKLAPHPKKMRPDVPDWLDEIVAVSLQKERVDRFQSAEELRQSLEQKRVLRQAGATREPLVPDLDDFSDLLGRIPRLTIATGVVLQMPDDLPAAAQKDWQASLEAFFEPQGTGGFLDWLKEDVIETLRKLRNLPVRKKMEELLAKAQGIHQQALDKNDLLSRSWAFTEFLAGFPSFHPPVVGFAPEKGLDFGELGLGEAALKRTLAVKNLGGSPMVYRFVSNHPALVVDQQTLFTCPAGETQSHEVTFQPQEDFPMQQAPKSLLQVITNIGELEIPVQYVLLPPRLVLSDSLLAFGFIVLEDSKVLILSNPGRSPLAGSLVVSVPWLQLKPPDLQFRCEPGEHYRVRLSLLAEQLPGKGGMLETALLLKTNVGEQTIPVRVPAERLEAEHRRLQEAEEKVRREAKKKADEIDRQAAEARKELILELAPGVEMEFVRVPAGEFEMGCEDGESDEKPVHRVRLDEYLIGKYLVTNRQYQAFVKATGHGRLAHWKEGEIPPGKEEHPVVYVNWQDAIAYCEWASQVSGKKVRLPTEAEWEKAARGMDGRKYPWGNQAPDASRCNYINNVSDTTPVGKYSPAGDSPYGGADMAGNVWEWVNDWYHSDYYANSPLSNPGGPSSGQSRVMRGGAWSLIERHIRTTNRYWNIPRFPNLNFGFRCARSTFLQENEVIIREAAQQQEVENNRLPAQKRKQPEFFLTLAPGMEMEFVRVPAGEFQMGSEVYTNEKPVHKVRLDEYLMGKYLVTNRQYQVFVKATGHGRPVHWKDGNIPTGKEEHPVVNVNWQGAIDFCEWASQVIGKKVRLPSEAEWEKAARGTDGRKYPWGNQAPDASRCNYNNKVKDTTPVGKYSPKGDSPYGCVDMAGNVWEWMNDWYDENYYRQSPASNPSGAGSGSLRVLRGGAWDLNEDDVRSAYRNRLFPGNTNHNIGFRCVSSLPWS